MLILKGCLCFHCSGNMSVKANRQLACSHPSSAATSTLHILITGELTASPEINALFKRWRADWWWKWMKSPFSLPPFSTVSLRYLLANPGEGLKHPSGWRNSSAFLINAVFEISKLSMRGGNTVYASILKVHLRLFRTFLNQKKRINQREHNMFSKNVDVETEHNDLRANFENTTSNKFFISIKKVA